MQMKKMIHEHTLTELLLEDSILAEGITDILKKGFNWAASGLGNLLEKFGDTQAGKLLATLLNSSKQKANKIERENDVLLLRLFDTHEAWNILMTHGAEKNVPGSKDGTWWGMLPEEDKPWVADHLQNRGKEFSYLLGQVWMWKEKNSKEKDQWFSRFVNNLETVEQAIGSAAGAAGDVTTGMKDLGIKLSDFSQEAVDKTAGTLGDVALLGKYAVKFFKATSRSELDDVKDSLIMAFGNAKYEGMNKIDKESLLPEMVSGMEEWMMVHMYYSWERDCINTLINDKTAIPPVFEKWFAEKKIDELKDFLGPLNKSLIKYDISPIGTNELGKICFDPKDDFALMVSDLAANKNKNPADAAKSLIDLLGAAKEEN